MKFGRVDNINNIIKSLELITSLELIKSLKLIKSKSNKINKKLSL